MTATKEKEITLEIPLEELEEIQELWRDVGAFQQVLDRLTEGQDETYDPLLRIFNPIYERFCGLMGREPDLDQRIVDARERGAE